MSLQRSNKSDSESNSDKRNKSRSRDKKNNMEISSDETSSTNTKISLTRKAYTIKDKIKFIQSADKNGIKTTAKSYGIGLTSIKRLMKHKDEYMAIEKKN